MNEHRQASFPRKVCTGTPATPGRAANIQPASGCAARSASLLNHAETVVMKRVERIPENKICDSLRRIKEGHPRFGREDIMRAFLERRGLKRLTARAQVILEDALDRISMGCGMIKSSSQTPGNNCQLFAVCAARNPAPAAAESLACDEWWGFGPAHRTIGDSYAESSVCIR